ncbi:MAG: T9SS type A sorting domain-containing protein [Bacteroidetes bacterium]|nr:T9SS type A sorting domain-containing protein [Bacteroidota bacterium]
MFKRIILFAVSALLISAKPLFCQQFSLVESGIAGVGRSSLAWGDFDNDNDLDLLVTGNQGSGPYIASIYRNDNGNFVNINAGLTGIDNSSVAWGDYDNDGDLDILATGRSGTSVGTWIYRNKNGVFAPMNLGLPNIGSYGCVAWGDYDGDGDLDALLTGGYFSFLYRNDGGSFVNTNSSLPLLSNSCANFGDFDNDGDQDIFMCGDVGGWPISCICRNDNGIFTELDSTGITALSSASASWADYDHDNDLDLLISGFNQYLEPVTSIYMNTGHLHFENVWPGLIGAALGTSAWGDYDNDGDADIILTGQNAACGSLSSIIYRNDGNNNFTDINAGIEGAERGSASWGDYDNDGDLDLIVSGFNGSDLPSTRLYQNTDGSNIFEVNTPPEAPSNLTAITNDHLVVFSWDHANDNSTPYQSLTYNLRVGTTPGSQDVFSAFADPVTGNKLVPFPGNLSNNLNWSLNLPDGIYYWSVQTIDHSLAASPFAEEQQFSVSNVGLAEYAVNLDIKVTPNPFADNIIIEGSSSFSFQIHSVSGQIVFSAPSVSSKIEIGTKSWIPGIYILECKGSDFEYHVQLIKK